MRRIISILSFFLLIASTVSYSQDFRFQASYRENIQIWYGQSLVTFGYHLSKNNILGVSSGYCNISDDASPGLAEGVPLALYYRHSFPLGKSRLSICTDFFIGGLCYTWTSKGYRKHNNNPPKKGDWEFYGSFQPSLDIGLGKNRRSHIFLGPSILPSGGIHLGYAISF